MSSSSIIYRVKDSHIQSLYIYQERERRFDPDKSCAWKDENRVGLGRSQVLSAGVRFRKSIYSPLLFKFLT